MRIAVFTKSTTFHNGYGGLETQNKNLCEGLASRGYEIVVFSPKKELKNEKIVEKGVTYVFIDSIFKRFSTLTGFSPKSWNNAAFESFKKFHTEQPFDLIIGQSSWALPLILRKKDLKLKVISVIHGSKIGEFRTRMKSLGSLKDILSLAIDLPHVLRAFFNTQREFIFGSDKIIAVSEFVKDSIIEETYVSEDRIVVVHNGVDPTMFRDVSLNKKGGKVNIIYTGRLIRAKGLFLLIDVLSLMNKNDVSLTLVGDGEDRIELEKYTKSRGLSETVTFKGNLKYSETLNELSESDIFVLPTLRLEGFPMTIVEAMMSGLPVVASDIGGNKDAIINKVTGYLTIPGNKGDLQKYLEILIKDSEMRIKMGQEGRKKAISEFSLEVMLNKYEEVISELLRN